MEGATAVGQAETPAISDAIRRIGALAAGPRASESFGSGVLDALQAVVPFEHGTFNEFDPVAKRSEFAVRPTTAGDPGWTAETYARYLPDNPFFQYVNRTGDASAHRLSDFVTPEELRQLSLYEHVLAPAGINFQVAFGLPARRPLIVGIGLSRAEHDFSNAECDRLNRLRPHLIQAYRTARLIGEYQHVLHTVSEALAREGRAVLVLSGNKVVFSEPAADGLLGRHFPGTTRNRLPEPVLRWLEQERSRAQATDLGRISQPFVQLVDGRRLILRFVPGAGGGDDALLLDERHADQDMIALQQLGLTAREADVMRSLIWGAEPREIATRLGISEHTVRTYTEKIYRKLGVSSRAAATALALEALHLDGGRSQ